MKIMPGADEVARYRAEGKYKVVPVSCELLADICTPIQAVRKLKNVSAHCFLLESAPPCISLQPCSVPLPPDLV